MPNDLAINVELLSNCNHFIGSLFVGVDLQTMPHVEDFVHFVPIGARGCLNHAEERGQRQHVVLHDVQLVNEMQYLGLGTATAMDDAVDLLTEVLQNRDHQRGVGAGGREDEFTYINTWDFGGVGEFVGTGIDQVIRDAMVVALVVFLGQIMVQHVVARRGKAVAAHAAVVAVLVGGLSVGSEGHDDYC